MAEINNNKKSSRIIDGVAFISAMPKAELHVHIEGTVETTNATGICRQK